MFYVLDKVYDPFSNKPSLDWKRLSDDKEYSVPNNHNIEYKWEDLEKDHAQGKKIIYRVKPLDYGDMKDQAIELVDFYPNVCLMSKELFEIIKSEAKDQIEGIDIQVEAPKNQASYILFRITNKIEGKKNLKDKNHLEWAGLGFSSEEIKDLEVFLLDPISTIIVSGELEKKIKNKNFSGVGLSSVHVIKK